MSYSASVMPYISETVHPRYHSYVTLEIKPCGGVLMQNRNQNHLLCAILFNCVDCV